MWAQNYILKRFPDCWQLVRKIYEDELGIDLPPFSRQMVPEFHQVVRKMETESKSNMWERIETPIDLCVVALSRGRLIHHVGVFTDFDGGKVLHAEEGRPTVAHSISQLKFNGYRRINFYVLA